MKILIAPDSFDESLSAKTVSDAIEEGFKSIYPSARYAKIPLANGGEGTLQSLLDILEGESITVTTTSPIGALINSQYGLFNGGETAIIELAQCCGLALLPEDKRHPGITTTYGLGEIILDALDRGAKHLIITLSNSATNDAGVGMMQALGASFKDEAGEEIPFGGFSLAKIATIDLTNLDPRLQALTIDVACDVDNPLIGPLGTSYTCAGGKGASNKEIERLEAAMVNYVDIVKNQYSTDLNEVIAGGSAGGVGATLHHFLGGKLRSGIEIIIEMTNLESYLKNADLVITGEGRIDAKSIHGQTILGVAQLAKKYNRPVIALSEIQTPDAELLTQYGVDATFGAINLHEPAGTALLLPKSEAYQRVVALSKNIARFMSIAQSLPSLSQAPAH